MHSFPEILDKKLEKRIQENFFRRLDFFLEGVDFFSNDYLGMSREESLFEKTYLFLTEKNIKFNGAGGSRLISGNHLIYEEAEEFIKNFHQSESALIFNSGYCANIGFFSAVPQRNDAILFDELIHASIRDGIKMGNAKSFKFKHNDLECLEKRIRKIRKLSPSTNIYIVTESIFSMDGDSPNLPKLVNISERYSCFLIVDEAHALGVFGVRGEGLIQSFNLQDRIFARIVTFGKALGGHGSAILGSQKLRDYLVNYARSFIYTTALPPHCIAYILLAYQAMEKNQKSQVALQENILFFNREKEKCGLDSFFRKSNSTIQSAIIDGNTKVKAVSEKFRERKINVKAILSPTVPEGQERLRFCVHSFNTEEEIKNALSLLRDIVKNF